MFFPLLLRGEISNIFTVGSVLVRTRRPVDVYVHYYTLEEAETLVVSMEDNVNHPLLALEHCNTPCRAANAAQMHARSASKALRIIYAIPLA